ncbi:heavy metal translocating P-type ATPase [Atopobacter phocae]|uniref:heavy metal translocating P-type ATPase n=1 Tax=Atopobacter phocae TaxID=136492 RepID=UPI0004B05C7E|nr:heavy metal translocating P-type ATPase [Atopobacter phocae]
MEITSNTHGHSHHHTHGNWPIVLYFIGLMLAILAFFTSPSIISAILYITASLLAGYHVILIEGISETIEHSKIAQRFTPNSHLLMGLAAIGSAIMGNYGESALLVLIFAGAHLLEDYVEGRSKRDINALLAMNPTTARLLLDDESTEVVDVHTLNVGDHLLVLNGDSIPIDGIIIAGTTTVNESSINGESLPKDKTVGDAVFASTINVTDSFKMKVTKLHKDTVFSKITQLVQQNQANQAPITTKIQHIEPLYVNAVLIMIALFMVFMPLLFNWSWSESVQRGLTLLVAASPCALAATSISASLSATSNLARHGVLSRGSAYLAKFADIEAIAFDKTGTLTSGQPQVVHSFFNNDYPHEFLFNVIVAMERQSNHPLAKAIVNFFDPTEIFDLEVENQIGKGLTSYFNDDLYQIGKPDSFNLVDPTIHAYQQQWSQEGQTVVFVAVNHHVVGLIGLRDEPSPHAKNAIHYFNQQQVHTTLLTGDAQLTGDAIGKQLGIEEIIAHVMPDDKSKLIQKHQQHYGYTAMVGDGVNDAIALVSADVGIAMGEGTDVAVEVSDLVLMKNDLNRLIHTHQLAKKMKRIIQQNIGFAMFIVALLVTGTLLDKTNITSSILIHEGSTLVVILNGLRLLND